MSNIIKIYVYILAIFFQIVFVFHCSAHSAVEEIREGSKKAQHTGKVRDTFEYVKSLYTLPEGISEQGLLEKKNTITYFLTSGVLEQPSTEEDKLVLQDAALFLGLIDAADPSREPDVDFTRIRRSYGYYEDTKQIQQCLALAQKYYTCGRMIGQWHRQPNPHFIKIILSQSYLMPRLTQEFASGQQPILCERELGDLLDELTPALAVRASRLWDDIMKVQAIHLMAMGRLKEEDVTSLPEVIITFENIIRDTFAFSVPIRWINSSSFYELQRPSSIGRSGRPLVIVLKNGTVIIRKADGSFYSHNHTNLVGYVAQIGQTFLWKHQNEKELLELLSKETSTVALWYLPTEGYTGLTSQAVWPEAFPIVCGGDSTSHIQTPNTELIQSLLQHSILKCEEGVENLNHPQYKTPYTRNMPRIKALTEIMETLKNLTGIREETKHFTDDCEELRLKLMEAMKDINTLDRKKGGYSEDFQLRNSYLQYRFTDKMFFNLVKDVSFNLEKIHHLVHPLPFYYSPEPCDETDVLPTDLPSYEEIEEGEAEITRSNNTLDIKVTSDRAVITFEDVWVGAEAKVIIRLPSDKAIISVYQRSGRASYIFGKIECEKGLIEFYSPRVIPESSTNIKRVKIFRNNSYQPENTRLYPIDLTGHQIFNEDYEEFDQSNKNRDQDDRDTDPDFWQTPEGQFEQEWIALDEKLGDNFDSIIECRELLAIALKYQTAGHPFAKVRASELKIELADRLYKKVQTLPYDAQYPAIEKIRKLCEGATDCKGIEASKADLQLSIADWLLQDGDKLYQTNQDMAFNRYLEAVRLLLVAEKAGEISVSPHIEETQEAMEAILIDKALAFSHIPLGSPSNWKKYLHSLNRLFSLRDEFLAAGLNLRSEQLQEQLEEFENFKAAMLLIDSGP